MTDFKPLTKGNRSRTFDSRYCSTDKREGTFDEFKPLTKADRAHTFKDTSESKPKPLQRSRSDSYTLSDVLYRRHFVVEDTNASTLIHFKPLLKGHSFVEYRSKSPEVEDKNQAIIVVDVFSTGAVLVNLLKNQGYCIININSGDLGDLLEMVMDGLV